MSRRRSIRGAKGKRAVDAARRDSQQRKGADGIVFQCKACGKRFKGGDKLAGRRLRCKCGAVLQIPASKPMATAAAPVAAPSSAAAGADSFSDTLNEMAAYEENVAVAPVPVRPRSAPSAATVAPRCPACGASPDD